MAIRPQEARAMRTITVPPVYQILVSRLETLISQGVCAALMLALAGAAFAAGVGGDEVAGAKIIEMKGKVEITAEGQNAREARPGDFIYEGENIIIPGGGAATLALYDKTLREFTGPTTLSIREGSAEGGTILGNLTAAVADMLFTSNPQSSQAVMATRSIDSGDDVVSLPVLTQPSPGENLVKMPRQFRWRGIRGVPLYRVTVYNSSEVMWQTTTSDAGVRWSVKDCDFAPGETYYWVVEALVGNTILRSQAGEFTLFDKEGSASLSTALGDAGASVSDPARLLALKARICFDSRAYSKAIDVLDESIEAAPSAEAYALRAEVNDALGRTEDAIADYRKAMSLASTD
jgi:hypothetical protein